MNSAERNTNYTLNDTMSINHTSKTDSLLS